MGRIKTSDNTAIGYSTYITTWAEWELMGAHRRSLHECNDLVARHTHQPTVNLLWFPLPFLMKPGSHTSSETLKKIHWLSLQLRQFHFFSKCTHLCYCQIIKSFLKFFRVKSVSPLQCYSTYSLSKTKLLWNFPSEDSK